MSETRHQLIVIGNGFDLSCGLPSSYNKFFSGAEEEIFYAPLVDGTLRWGESIKSLGYTVWDIILSGKAIYTQWYDVEGEIADWVLDQSESYDTHLGSVRWLLLEQRRGAPVHPILAKYEYTPERLTEFSISWRTDVPESLSRYPEVAVARYIMETRPDWESLIQDSCALRDFFLDELHRLEQRFTKYLSDAMRGNDDYIARASELYNLLAKDHTYADDRELETSLINFNYTMIIACGGFDLPRNTNGVNIHGCLDEENIIFGIDGTKCLDDSFVLPFTKTYRIMDLMPGDIADIVYSQQSVAGAATSMIKFFGHSLSEADYSYFQALFDIVDLYNGTTHLFFYYRPYKAEDIDGRIALEETKGRVTRLLSAYGKTLDNKDHGKNLIHRLLVEGRLHIQRI